MLTIGIGLGEASLSLSSSLLLVVSGCCAKGIQDLKLFHLSNVSESKFTLTVILHCGEKDDLGKGHELEQIC